jgi:hypothetical protein
MANTRDNISHTSKTENMPLSGDISNYIHQYQHTLWLEVSVTLRMVMICTGSPTKQKKLPATVKNTSFNKMFPFKNFTSDEQ